MRNLSFLIVILFSFTFFSCEKNDDITVTINESGSLEIRIVDDNKEFVTNASVTLYDVKTGSILLKEETNATGVFKMDKILQGSYRCFISTEKDGKTYTTTTFFQIFSKDSKVVEYNPFSNAGTINVAVNIAGIVSDITKYTVAVVPGADYSNNINSVKEYALFSKALDKDGKVQITNIPAEQLYVVCVYKDNEIFASNSLYMQKKEQNMQLSFSVGALNVQVEGEIANYADYEVLVTPYYSSNTSIEYIRANTLFSIKLDANKKATITELSKTKDYNVYLVKKDIVFDRYNFYFNTNNLDVINTTLRVGSISIKVKNSIENPANYSIALARYYFSDINSLKNEAFATGKLNSDASIKFTELPVINSFQNNCYAYLYKDSKIYDYNSFSWYDLNTLREVYLYVSE